MKLLAAVIYIGAMSLSANAQDQRIIGAYGNNINPKQTILKINSDHTFDFKNDNNTYEKGIWALNADTLLLNPHLEPKPLTTEEIVEKTTNDTGLTITFNWIKREFNSDGSIYNYDTLQFYPVSLSLNEQTNRREEILVAHKPFHPHYGRYKGKQIIGQGNTIRIDTPIGGLHTIQIKLAGKEQSFQIKNPNSNYLIFNHYENNYSDGQIRHRPFIVMGKYLCDWDRKGRLKKPRAYNWNHSEYLLKRH